MGSDAVGVQLGDLKCFHGYLPREDLVFLLKKEGDFIVRCTEVDGSENRNYVISYYPEGKGNRQPTESGVDGAVKAKVPIRHVVIHEDEKMLFIKESHKFASIVELINFHTLNEISVGEYPIKLLNPIQRAHWELQHCDIELNKYLGHGEFGEVRSGKWQTPTGKSVDVAVKVTKGNTELSKQMRREMMTEARMMRDLRHPHVVKIHGVAVLEWPLFIVLEMVHGGSLDKFLKSGRVLSRFDRRRIIMGIAWGIEYIHSKNIVHRDLAARNCLINHRTLQIKISDFGMSRLGPLYKLRNPAKVPIRWMAPETLKHFTFTFKTDVWSFGMIILEIYADGSTPYEGKTNGEVKTALLNGENPRLPPICSRQLVTFMENNIWVPDEKRFEIKEVVTFLEKWSKLPRPNFDDENVYENQDDVEDEDDELEEVTTREIKDPIIKEIKIDNPSDNTGGTTTTTGSTTSGEEIQKKETKKPKKTKKAKSKDDVTKEKTADTTTTGTCISLDSKEKVKKRKKTNREFFYNDVEDTTQTVLKKSLDDIPHVNAKKSNDDIPHLKKSHEDVPQNKEKKSLLRRKKTKDKDKTDSRVRGFFRRKRST